MKSLLLIIGIVFIFASAAYLHYSGSTLDFFAYKIRGIDVSSHQGNVSWESVANTGVKFAYIKATEADDLKDQKFATNFDQAKKAGIKVGAYHYFSLAYGGEVQAKNFIETVPVDKNQLPPVIDLEYVGNSTKRPSKEVLQNELQIYIKLVKDRYGKEPILYTTKVFYYDYLYPEMKGHPIWMRNLFFAPKENWIFWQYSQWGKVAGIDGFVDLDYFYGEDLDSLSD